MSSSLFGCGGEEDSKPSLASGWCRENHPHSVRASSRSHTLCRQEVWTAWFKSGIVRDMLSAPEQVKAAGLSMKAIREKAAGPADEDEE